MNSEESPSAGFTHRTAVMPENYVGRVAHFQRKRIRRFQNWQTVRAVRMAQDVDLPVLHTSSSVSFAKFAPRIANRAVAGARLHQPFGEVWLDWNEAVTAGFRMSRSHFDLHRVEVNV